MEDSKLYELILKYKSETEKVRDEINKYYTSLFSVFLSLMPFLLDKISPYVGNTDKNLMYITIITSVIGFILSLSWKRTLQSIHNYLKGLEQLLMTIEKKFDTTFITYMADYLHNTNSPTKATKQEMIVPYAFIGIFISSFIYAMIWIFMYE